MATFTRLINIFVSFQILGLGGEPEFGGETVLVTADNLVSDIDDDDDDDIIETQFVVQDNFDATAAGDQTGYTSSCCPRHLIPDNITQVCGDLRLVSTDNYYTSHLQDSDSSPEVEHTHAAHKFLTVVGLIPVGCWFFPLFLSLRSVSVIRPLKAMQHY